MLLRMLRNRRGEVDPPPNDPPPNDPPPNDPPPNDPPPAAFDPTALNALQGDDFLAVLPESMRAQGYMKDVTNFEGFTKKFEGAQSLIGQRAVPGAEGTPEQWDAYFKQAGRPDTAAEYQFGEVEGVPKEFVDDLAKAGLLPDGMHLAGLNQHQAKALSDHITKTIFAAETADKAAEDKALTDALDGNLGKDREEIVKNGKAIMAAHLPDSMKGVLDQLDSKGLAIALAIANTVAQKYGGEDVFTGGTPPASGNPPATQESIQGEMSKIMAQKEYQDPFLNPAKNAELKTQMEAYRNQLRNLTKKS